MADLRGFNAHSIEPISSFEPLPAGKYLAAIIGSEMKSTKAGNGAYLELTFQIIDGEYRGRRLWARLNLDNPNPSAVKIARAELAAICRAVGVLEPQDSCELHDLPLVIIVRQKTGVNGETRNEISGYAKRETLDSARPIQAANPTPPWRRGE